MSVFLSSYTFPHATEITNGLMNTFISSSSPNTGRRMSSQGVSREEPLPRSSSTHPSVLHSDPGEVTRVHAWPPEKIPWCGQPRTAEEKEQLLGHGLGSGISGINDLVSEVLGEGRDTAQMFPVDICGASAFCTRLCLEWFPHPLMGWRAFAQRLYTSDLVTCSRGSIALLFPECGSCPSPSSPV